jgi:hypothetical protein
MVNTQKRMTERENTDIMLVYGKPEKIGSISQTNITVLWDMTLCKTEDSTNISQEPSAK